ncbi:hypothetical protein SAMN05421788_11638 [Filimonas lacunae]|uniref:Uncharacterized protein n=1 Tax=Filimonas lacunae TaxID=477680 RepID=A0A173MH03_9BACT|nr:hypothetical protein [Filimonas lacunae]BAV06757.1 hypothetical protein FLA_2777 [Filimonas lacunae]SIT34400.1 hypothetical protein SAMN05421788_11638 [Filimonas lacunae]
MPLTKVLITVKTYPSISAKYDELVCTAGFREDGSWIRIYPIAFRKKTFAEKYSKYDWIEMDLVKNESDFRPESYRPFSHDTPIKIIDKVDTASNWAIRKQAVLGKVHYNLSELIAEAKDKSISTSFAVFKPTRVLDFKIEEVDRDWDKDKMKKLVHLRSQMDLFKQEVEEDMFQVVRKLPYKFSYLFEDVEGKQSCLMIEDWEIGQLYWNCLDKHKDETKAIADVRAKYMDDFAKTKDLFFYLGTTQLHHYTSHNPFIIIGTFHPKKELQQSLF